MRVQPNKPKRKFKLLDDVVFQPEPDSKTRMITYIISIMPHKKEPMYLIASYAKPVSESQLKAF